MLSGMAGFRIRLALSMKNVMQNPDRANKMMTKAKEALGLLSPGRNCLLVI
jgi:hypothetical protein